MVCNIKGDFRSDRDLIVYDDVVFLGDLSNEEVVLVENV